MQNLDTTTNQLVGCSQATNQLAGGLQTTKQLVGGLQTANQLVGGFQKGSKNTLESVSGGSGGVLRPSQPA